MSTRRRSHKRPNRLADMGLRLLPNRGDLIQYEEEETSQKFINACKKGDFNRAVFYIQRRLVRPGLLNSALDWSCFGGNKYLIAFILKNGANNWDNGLYGACLGGHEDIAEWMISLGATDYDYGLEGACRGGFKKLAQIMINKGATDWDNGLYAACSMGYKELVVFMIEKGAVSLDRGLLYASLRGHKDLSLFLIIKGADIDRSRIIFTTFDIKYLQDRGVVNFGSYTAMANYWREWRLKTGEDLSGIMIPDLANLVISSYY